MPGSRVPEAYGVLLNRAGVLGTPAHETDAYGERVVGYVLAVVRNNDYFTGISDRRLDSEDDSIRLSVSGDGVGLPEDYAERGRGFRGKWADAER